MSWPIPTRQDHQKFCETEGWRRVRDAKGRTGTHHLTYEFALPDGTVIRTRISHPPDRTDIRKGLFAHILRDQLAVSQKEFWVCINDGIVPNRGGEPLTGGEPLPPEIVHLLIEKVGLEDHQVCRLTKDEAVKLLQEYWSRSPVAMSRTLDRSRSRTDGGGQ